MPTIISHAAVPLAVGLGLGRSIVSRLLLITGICVAMLPDLDVLAFNFHIAYTDNFGHRGATHSILFAICLALCVTICGKSLKDNRFTIFLFTFFSAVSHGILDTFTNGGKGVALFWPFNNERLFAPWNFIQVSPIGVNRLFSHRMWVVACSELMGIWIPALIIFVLLRGINLFRKQSLGSALGTGKVKV